MNEKEINIIKELINELDRESELVKEFWKWYSEQATDSTIEQVCSEAMIFILKYLLELKE